MSTTFQKFCIVLCYGMYIMLYCVMLCCVILCVFVIITSCITYTLHYITSHYTSLHHIILHCVTFTSHYVQVALHHIIFQNTLNYNYTDVYFVGSSNSTSVNILGIYIGIVVSVLGIGGICLLFYLLVTIVVIHINAKRKFYKKRKG